MQLHSHAATCPRQRQLIRNSAQPLRTLAHNLGISVVTAHTWKHRENPCDRSCRPKTIHYALKDDEEAMVLWMRKNGEMLLDDLLDLAQPLLPHLRRSSLHRLLKRHGCSKFPQKSSNLPGTWAPSRSMALALFTSTVFICPNSMGRNTTALWPSTERPVCSIWAFTKTKMETQRATFSTAV